MRIRTRWPITLALAGVTVTHAGTLDAQERGPDRITPTNAVVVSGYGTVGHNYLPADGEGSVPSAFQAGFNPIFLFQFQDRVLFEAELEFELEDGITETGLEYAQLDVMATDNLTVVAGKFLLPFGVFGDRLHPTWINKMASAPPIYGHGATGFGAEPLLAVLKDVGAMAKAAIKQGSLLVGISGYVTQGFQVEEHAEEAGHEEEPGADHVEIPEIGIPGSSGDVTNNKMVGGRIDVALPPWAELNISALTGKYDEADLLTMSAWNLAGELRRSGFEVRGEYLRTRQEFEEHEGVAESVRSGFYAQSSYRSGPWEPVLRITRINADKVEDVAVSDAVSQTAFGLNYWISPSVAVMTAYEFNREDGPTMDNDRLTVHMTFGF